MYDLFTTNIDFNRFLLMLLMMFGICVRNNSVFDIRVIYLMSGTTDFQPTALANLDGLASEVPAATSVMKSTSTSEEQKISAKDSVAT